MMSHKFSRVQMKRKTIVGWLMLLLIYSGVGNAPAQAQSPVAGVESSSESVTIDGLNFRWLVADCGNLSNPIKPPTQKHLVVKAPPLNGETRICLKLRIENQSSQTHWVAPLFGYRYGGFFAELVQEKGSSFVMKHSFSSYGMESGFKLPGETPTVKILPGQTSDLDLVAKLRESDTFGYLLSMQNYDVIYEFDYLRYEDSYSLFLTYWNQSDAFRWEGMKLEKQEFTPKPKAPPVNAQEEKKVVQEPLPPVWKGQVTPPPLRFSIVP
jgi:hypothetical protein